VEEFVMSVSEIADNKWELEATKAPVLTPGGLAQIALFMSIIGWFGYILVMSVVAIASPKKESNLVEIYRNMRNDPSGTAAPNEKPTE
jgi:hypothetical protein